MDKVYVKLLSVSLLLSLYGAGFAEPHSQLRSMLRDVLLAADSEARPQGVPFMVRAASLGGDCCAPRGGSRASSLLRLRSLVSSLTGRLASLCRRGAPCVDDDTALSQEDVGSSVFHAAIGGTVTESRGLEPYAIVCVSPSVARRGLRALFFDIAPSRAGPCAHVHA